MITAIVGLQRIFCCQEYMYSAVRACACAGSTDQVIEIVGCDSILGPIGYALQIIVPAHPALRIPAPHLVSANELLVSALHPSQE